MNHATMNHATIVSKIIVGRNEKILVLGFYDRRNTGDECYKIAVRRVLDVATEVVFWCMDDITERDIADIDPQCVIIGGGDVVNDYFMQKARKLLRNYIGMIYGLSIGCPYASCLAHLDMFDHVFSRSGRDTQLAIQRIGEENVTQVNDISTALMADISDPRRYVKTPMGVLRIGVSLAQPVFYGNPNADAILNTLIEAFRDIASYVSTKYIASEKLQRIEWYLIPFNYNNSNKAESDHEINAKLIENLGPVPCIGVTADDQANVFLVNPDFLVANNAGTLSRSQSVMQYIHDNIDIMVCMRYHAVMFSMITGTPFVALYSSTKIQGCLDDLCNESTTYGVLLDVDNRPPYNAKGFSKAALVATTKSIIDNNDFQLQRSFERMMLLYSRYQQQVSIIRDKIIKQRIVKQVHIHRSHVHFLCFEEVMRRCVWALGNFLKMDRKTVISLTNSPVVEWTGVLRQAFGETHDIQATADTMARLVCFSASMQLNDPCMWGMREAILERPICLRESLIYVWQHHKDTCTPMKIFLSNALKRTRGLVSIDPHINNALSSMSTVHRSGWGYVTQGLLSLDMDVYGRDDAEIFVDTFVDRTFHWSCSTLEMFGVLPYKSPWYGFIHHTFDTTHSEYNCVNLLANPLFMDSLKTCRGLIVLSRYLGDQLKDALAAKMSTAPPIHVVYHPMFTPTDKMFEMSNFIGNADRSLVQIGAWLREPYLFYTLDMSLVNYPLKKKALKGSYMDLNFPPVGYEEFVRNIPFEYPVTTKRRQSRDALECRDQVCRDKMNNCNKFLKGMTEVLLTHVGSVEVIDRLDNDAYDALLSSNIVFLNLVDCSAANTVIECIVRNTPLIINRLPALQEVLGSEYPGFYDTPGEALTKCDTYDKVAKIHEYLTKLDKQRYDLDHFLQQIEYIVEGGEPKTAEYTLIKEVIPVQIPVMANKFKDVYSIDRYLPTWFMNK